VTRIRGEPQASVIIVVGDRRVRSARALRSVLDQDGLDEAEILLIDAGSDGVAPIPGADHPAVTVLKIDVAAGFGALKATGVRRARGSVLLFLEDHAEARPGWLQAALKSCTDPWAGVGCEVHNANAGVGLSDSIYEINYGRWAPPLARGEAELLAGNNTIYRRQILLAYEPGLDDLLSSDTVLQWRLSADGHKLLAEPAASILHRNPTTLGNGIQAEFLYHWCFGAVRASALRWTRRKKLGYLALSPLIPWIRCLRLTKLLLRRRTASARHVVQTTAISFVLMHAAVFGQAVGIAFGLQAGLGRFTRFELNSPRPLKPG